MFQKTRIVSAISAALALSAACTAASAGTLTFDPIPFAAADAEKRAMEGSDNATVNKQPTPIGFKTLVRSGDELPLLVGTAPSATQTIRYGTLVKKDGTALIDEATGAPAISNSNDFNSLLQAGGNLYLVSHFETRPAAMYLTLLDQEANGDLVAKATRPIDFSAVEGGWVHCAGSVSPWGTHLGSEEYEPDARQWVDPAVPISAYNAAMHGYYDAAGWKFNNGAAKGDPIGDPVKAKALVNPYDYGWTTEIAVQADGSTDVTKHYAMGRLAVELAYVMPDKKTAYITDDGTNTLLALFVADTAGDLSAGTLYAAKWTQVTGNETNGGRANLSWVNLGHATNAEIEAYLAAGTDFADVFDYESVPNPDTGTCPTLTSVNSGHAAPYHECLRVKPGMAKAASRLELRRYAALKGATTEFRKMEGITYNPELRVLYLAMSEVNNGMLDSTTANTAIGGNNHIRVPRNDCGAVYSMAVGGAVKDTNNQPIASAYVARTITGIVAGKPVSGDPKNTCDINGIANPDNVTYLPRYNTLIIGEDTGSGHQNDAVWSMDLRTGKLARILSTPYGSETTSPYWYSDLNGFGYLMAVAQHPYGESDSDKLIPGSGDERAYTGYIGPFPALK